jgi:hypothetical protein
MTPKRKQSFMSHSHEASLAEDKSVHDWVDSNLDIQWCHAPNNGYICEEDRNNFNLINIVDGDIFFLVRLTFD